MEKAPRLGKSFFFQCCKMHFAADILFSGFSFKAIYFVHCFTNILTKHINSPLFFFFLVIFIYFIFRTSKFSTNRHRKLQPFRETWLSSTLNSLSSPIEAGQQSLSHCFAFRIDQVIKYIFLIFFLKLYNPIINRTLN